MESNTNQSLDFSRCNLPPFEHQIVGITKLVKEPIVGLWDVMGLGKSKQIIDAAQILYTQGLVNRVLIVAPASVRFVWMDQELGELRKHLWDNLPAKVILFHGKIRTWSSSISKESTERPLQFLVTNYEFIRNKDRREQLFHFCGPKTWLVLDESSLVKSYGAAQTKSCMVLRKRCGRITLLNGTPIANSPKDLFSQGQLLDKKILDCKTYYNFRGRYGVMGGWQGRQVVQWVNIEDLQRRFAPYVLCRRKEDCLDLPEKIPSVIMPAILTEKTWAIYKEMREEMIVWLNEATISMAMQAAVKGIRLAQVTSGFLGGVHESGLEEQPDPVIDRPDFIPFIKKMISEPIIQSNEIRMAPNNLPEPIQDISSEKLDVFLEWFDQKLVEDPAFKVLVWCRFRPELHRLFESLTQRPGVSLGKIWGGQKKQEREDALRLLDPRTMPKGPVVVMGTPSSGSMGLNLTGAHTVVYMSNDYSLKTRLQSEDRVHRPGQIHAVSYFDMVAVGPKGQKTIDHAIIKALRTKNDIATWTVSAWLDALKDE